MRLAERWTLPPGRCVSASIIKLDQEGYVDQVLGEDDAGTVKG